jgi:hypothetical protein
VDVATLLPYKFVRHLEENKYRKDEYCLFDRTKNEATVIDTTEKAAHTKNVFKISPGIEDIISAYFLFRNINFDQKKKGDTITIDVFLDNVSHNFKLRYIGKEKIKTEDGKQTAITVVPIISGIKGLASGDTPIKAWFSDDPRKLLLKVKAQLVLGSLELALQKHEDRTKQQP